MIVVNYCKQFIIKCMFLNLADGLVFKITITFEKSKNFFFCVYHRVTDPIEIKIKY